jgi:hypothetical protein
MVNAEFTHHIVDFVSDNLTMINHVYSVGSHLIKKGECKLVNIISRGEGLFVCDNKYSYDILIMEGVINKGRSQVLVTNISDDDITLCNRSILGVIDSDKYSEIVVNENTNMINMITNSILTNQWTNDFSINIVNKEPTQDIPTEDELLTRIDWDYIPQVFHKQFKDLIIKFKHIFDRSLKGSPWDLAEHDIIIQENVRPIKLRPYRFPQIQLEVLNQLCIKLKVVCFNALIILYRFIVL